MLTSNALWLIAAVLLQGALTIALAFYLGSIRVPMIVRGEVKVREIALSRDGWPERERKVSNAFDNQFQLPVLFFVAVAVAVFFGATLLEVLLGWAFVVLRIVHLSIHVSSNHVVRRFWAYVGGLGVLTVLWLDLIIRLIFIASVGGR